MPSRPAVVLFDSNETLLDLAALDPAFRAVFGTESARRIWFQHVLTLFLTATITSAYRPFDQLVDSALEMAAQQLGRDEIPKSARERIRHELQQMPLHADVKPTLDRLRGAGLRVATLTNSTEQAVRTQMETNDAVDLFERLLSADAIERYKPAREAYAYAARELGVAPGEILLVAAHGWDCAGALNAGCRAAFLRRPGQALDPKGPQPELDVRTLFALADALVG